MTLRPALVAAVALLGCAQYGAPPGGERDQRPPQVIETIPEPLSVVPDLRGPVVIRFDERLSERGAEDAVIVSPRTGDLRVRRRGSELRVELEGGWRPGQIYRVVILPELRDLFGNQRTEPAELVFSTGPEIPQTALAGIVTERITGRPPQRAVVEAVRQADSTVYVAPVATDGFYALLNLPNGEYEVMAYADANQDWTPGPTEPRSRAIGVTLSDDTLAHDLAILPFDTTAARVQNAAMQNGVIRVQLDDYVDSTGIAAASVTLYTVSDTTPLPGTFALRMSPPETARTDTRTDVDSAQAAVQDTLAAVQDTLAAEPDAPAELPGTEAVPATPAVPLPAREFFAIPTSPIAPGEYLLGVRGITNINGYPDGGGLVPLRVTPADTARALPDTIAVPDTSTMRVDTLRTLPDSTRIPPDSTRIPPDSTRIQPDPTQIRQDSTRIPPDTAQAPPTPPPPPGRRVHRP